MNVSTFTETWKNYDVSKIKNESNYNSILLDIVNYLFKEISQNQKDCKVVIVASEKDIKTKSINSLTFSCTCSDYVRKLKNKYVESYKTNNLSWTESGNNFVLKLGGQQSTSAQPTNQGIEKDEFFKQTYGALANAYFGVKESKNLNENINRIKKLMI